MSKTLQEHRTKLNKTKKTEAPTVSSRGQTTVTVCSITAVLYVTKFQTVGPL